jgi:O-antigen/teichoic acid export membrane protein
MKARDAWHSGAARAARIWSDPLRRSTAALLAARLTSALSTLVFLAFLSRSRGLEALGIGSLGVVTGSILASLAEAGTNSLTIREIARQHDRGPAILSAVLLLRLVTFPMFLLISLPLFGFVFGSSGTLVLVFALAFVVQQIAELARGVMLAVNRPFVVAGHAIVENVIWVAAMVAALVTGADLFVAAWLGLAVMVGSSVVGAYIVLRWGTRPGPVGFADLRHTAQLALPFAAYSIVMVAAFRMDTVLVSALVPSGIAAAGAYFAASRLMASAEYLPETLSRALYPELSRRAKSPNGDVAGVLRPAVRDLLAVSIPASGALVIGASALLPLIFGPDLAPYAWILTVLGLAVPGRFLAILLGVTLTSADAQGRRVAITVIAVIFGQGLNIALLPVIGITAAVMASLVTTLCLVVPYALESRHRFGAVVRPQDVLSPLFRTGVAALPALGFRMLNGADTSRAGLVISLVIYAACYGLATLTVSRLMGWLGRPGVATLAGGDPAPRA